MESRTQKRLNKVTHIVNTYIDDTEDIDMDTEDVHTYHEQSMPAQSWDGEDYDEELLRPPPDYDTDASSD